MKKTYESPQITVVHFKVELGFTASTEKMLSLDFAFLEGDKEIEQRTDGGYWGGNDVWF